MASCNYGSRATQPPPATATQCLQRQAFKSELGLTGVQEHSQFNCVQSKYQWLAEVDITRPGQPRPVLLMSEQERSGDQQKEVVNVGCQPSVAASSEPAT